VCALGREGERPADLEVGALDAQMANGEEVAFAAAGDGGRGRGRGRGRGWHDPSE
jgi:hypothetical protein